MRSGLIFGGSGITLGSIIAVLMSWSWNHSVILAIVHFFCSWVYVIFALIFHH